MSDQPIQIDPQDLQAFQAQRQEANQQTAIQRAEYLSKYYRPSLGKYLRKRIRMAVSFVRAVTSLVTQKRLSEAKYQARLVSCIGCEKLIRNPSAVLGHCGGCGCKRTSYAELTIKANMPGAKCPLGKWDGNRA